MILTVIFIVSLVLAFLWVRGKERMKSEHPLDTGDDLSSMEESYIDPNGISIMYNRYLDFASSLEEVNYRYLIDDPNQNCTRIMTEDEFWERVKSDSDFAQIFNWLEV
jgi:hypothetical protein